MAANQQKLSPDLAILATIFPDIPVLAHRVVSNTFDTCTFFATLSEAEKPAEVVVRLEKSRTSRLPAVAALQELARTRMSHLVPSTIKVGKAKTEDGTEVDFSVTEYYPDTVTLESVWNDLDHEQRVSIMQAVVDAISQLQDVRLVSTDDQVKHILEGTSFLDDSHQIVASVGGPGLGYFGSFTALLTNIVKPADPDQAPYTFTTGDDGSLTLESSYPDFKTVTVAKDQLDELNKSCVLCHNDIEPRNLLVRLTDSGYKLAAIIDWEMAGFIPFSLETGLKDTFLGMQNLYFSFYALYKKLTAHLVRATSSGSDDAQLQLIEAVRLAKLSKQRSMTHQVGAQVQRKWLEREKVELTSDVRGGWVRLDGVDDVGPFTEEDKNAIEQEVLKELGYI
ncbi:hypothetical protein FSARC_12080 [Fusarium sarcochroum]|uniref:Aminoglycoside phosphotransferase domain-containing protein n=1 Tax=Fusarium sarcochroum TaxID=1208366 RepID=A0A8H4WXK7_9HYPO|nr:hypothetical protein FSARC_12080 [Fusarium sarcochroum]